MKKAAGSISSGLPGSKNIGNENTLSPGCFFAIYALGKGCELKKPVPYQEQEICCRHGTASSADVSPLFEGRMASADNSHRPTLGTLHCLTS
jgi:hypothetical protein